MKIRKFVAVFMSVIILCIAIFSVPASATYTDVYSYSFDSCSFEIQPLNSSDAEIVSITLYYNYDYQYSTLYVPLIEIPSSIGGYNITSIAKDVVISKNGSDFSYEPVEIILPDTISTLESETFYNYQNITKVYIPPTISVVNENAFYPYSEYFTIYGEKDSSAYLYAVENDIPFVEFPQEISTTEELDYWIECAKKFMPYDEIGDSPYSSFSQYENLRSEYINAVYNIKNNFFTVQSDIDTSAYTLETAYKRLILELTINYVKYNVLSSYIYASTGISDPYYQIYSAKNLLELTSVTPSELDTAISNINNDVDNLVLQSEYDLSSFIHYYYYYDDHRLSEICTTDTYSYLYDTVSSSNSLLESLESEDSYYQDGTLEVVAINAKNNFSYKDPLYRDEIPKIIDAQNNLRLASYDTLKENVTTLEEFLNNEGYKYFSDSVWSLENMIGNANNILYEYESIICNPITTDSYDWYGFNTLYETIYNRNTKLVELNEQFVSMNNEINYMSAEDPYTGCKYGLMPIELGNVDMDYSNKTTLSDIVYVLRNILGTTTFDKRQQYAGDMNEDGTISLKDAILMQRKVLGV